MTQDTRDDQPAKGAGPSNTMWGGRFSSSPDAAMQAINASIAIDQRLADVDVAGSKAHAAMLARQGIISEDDAARIIAGLDEVLAAIKAGEIALTADLEDIHMNVEAALKDRIGEPAGRLHTARSRNDQVATDLRLWLRGALDGLCAQIEELQLALTEQAARHAATVMPGFTHLQGAQPVTFGHHLIAYVEMLERDKGRLTDARGRLNECPLGSAALAGTPYPIDRGATAEALGFDRPMRNSLDGVSARDFALEALAAFAICGAHLSRFAEELVIWTTPQFGFVSLSDSWTTGSSIMPQKRNPDAAELIRAKTGRLAGAFQGLLMVLKGLPMAYAKDLQEDKEPVFDAADTLSLMLVAMAGMVRDMQARPEAMRRAAEAGHPTATDLADWLVRALGLPFRQAHHVTGALVAEADRRGLQLWELPIEAMQQAEPRITAAVYDVLSVDASVAARVSEGGAAPVRVAEQAAAWLERLRPQPLPPHP